VGVGDAVAVLDAVAAAVCVAVAGGGLVGGADVAVPVAGMLGAADVVGVALGARVGPPPPCPPPPQPASSKRPSAATSGENWERLMDDPLETERLL